MERRLTVSYLMDEVTLKALADQKLYFLAKIKELMDRGNTMSIQVGTPADILLQASEDMKMINEGYYTALLEVCEIITNTK